MSIKATTILLAFYGDDFTGSTDALEFITRAGAKAVLFTDTPDEKQLQAFPGLTAYGVAGKTRALCPDEMKAVLAPAFQQLNKGGVKQVHYKVCSTFDSSPQVGSIGNVIDIATDIFAPDRLPVIGGTPALGRYCVFGNLFAEMGICSKGAIYRLDRHPSMSKHPVTPAGESDLRLHLQKQTDKKIGLINVLQLEQPVDTWNETIKEKTVLVDVLYEGQLTKIGEWLDNQYALKHKPVFTIGSSAVEAALGSYWNQQGLLTPKTDWPEIGKAAPLLVISGSCSPVTAAQIEWARSNGFEEIIIDADTAGDEGLSISVLNRLVTLLEQQKDVIVHTGSKNSDPVSSLKLGTALGIAAKHAVTAGHLKRVVVAGGDTSSYAARAMDIDAVEMIAPLVSGAPLCRAWSGNKAINGLEVNFKGGQVGAANYFGIMKNGKAE
ncbi:MAG: four-carbon acid sugar kinase family protein [Niabella sp.]